MEHCNIETCCLTLVTVQRKVAVSLNAVMLVSEYDLTCITDISDYPTLLPKSPCHVDIASSCWHRRMTTTPFLLATGSCGHDQETPGYP